jgi:hypothetical protein
MALNDSDQHAERLEEQANALRADWDASHLAGTLEKVIGMYEQLLALRPPGHAQRRQTVSDLGDALWRFCFYHITKGSETFHVLYVLFSAFQRF